MIPTTKYIVGQLLTTTHELANSNPAHSIIPAGAEIIIQRADRTPLGHVRYWVENTKYLNGPEWLRCGLAVSQAHLDQRCS